MKIPTSRIDTNNARVGELQISTMACPSCGVPARPSSKFCVACGTALGAPCGNCGTAASPADRFCMECGLPFGLVGETHPGGSFEAPPPGEPPSAPRAAPAPVPTLAPAQTAAPAADPAPGTNGPDVGARRNVVVLFADLSGFTAWSEKADPERIRTDLEALLAQISAAVDAYGGTIDKYIGDCAMAVFGYPNAHEDDPARAALAAIKMRDEVERVAAERKIPVRLKIGIHAGTVVAAEVGAGGARRATVIGDAVNVAARIQGQAQPGQILATEAVYATAQDRFVWRKLAPVSVKGREAPVLVYDLIGENMDTATSSEYQGTTWKSRAPLVGRTIELDLLERACRLAETGEGQVVTLIGDAGIGKSRLIYELVSTRLNRWNGLFASGRTLSYARTTAYLLFREPASTLLGLSRDPTESDAAATPADPGEDIRSAVARIGLPPEIAPALAPILSIRMTDARYDALAPEERKRRTIEAFAELAIARSREIPIVLRLEDLHWMDPASREILATLATRVRDARIAILAIGRPGFAPPWGTEVPSTQVTLRELSTAEGLELTRVLLGAETLPAEIEDAVAKRAEGNPLYVEETIAALVSAGILAKNDGEGWRLAKSLADAPLPTTLQGIVLSRYDRLPPPTRKTLAAASVLGRFFALDELIRLAGEDAAESLLPAIEARITLLQKTFPRREYVFKHVLSQETIYGNLLEADRKKLHAAAGRALEAEETGSKEIGAEAIAYHYVRSDEPARAVPFLMAAGRRAADLYSHEVSIEHFRAAADAALKANLFADAAEAFVLLGRSRGTTGALRDAVEDFRRAYALGVEQRIPSIEGRARYEMGRLERRLGDTPSAEESFRAALAISDRTGDRRLEAEVANQLGGLLLDRGVEAEAESVFEKGRAAAEVGHPTMVVYFLTRRAEILMRRGLIDEAEVLYRDVMNQCEEAGNVRGQGYVGRMLGTLAFRRGRFDEAIALYTESHRKHAEIGDRAGECWALSGLAAVQLRAGQLADAFEVASRAVEMARAMGYRLAEVECLATIASAERRSGRLAEALEIEKRAYAIIQETGDKRLIPRQAMRLATSYKDAGIFGEARRRYDEAIEGARSLGDGEVEARVLLPLANIAHDRGEYQKASEMLSRSVDLAKDLGLAVHEAFTCSALVRLAGDLGDLGRIDHAAKRAMELLDKMGHEDMRPWALVCDARRQILANDGVGAVESCRKAIESAERLGYKRFLVLGHYEMGLALHFGMNEGERQTEHLETALRLAEEIGEKAEFPHISIHLAANIVRRGGDLGRARSLFERCLALTEPQGFRRHTWRAHRHLAEIDQRTGDETSAADHEEKAVSILDEMPGPMRALFLERGGRAKYLASATQRLADAGRKSEA